MWLGFVWGFDKTTDRATDAGRQHAFLAGIDTATACKPLQTGVVLYRSARLIRHGEASYAFAVDRSVVREEVVRRLRSVRTVRSAPTVPLLPSLAEMHGSQRGASARSKMRGQKGLVAGPNQDISLIAGFWHPQPRGGDERLPIFSR